jgi:hypothetical protein
MQVSQSPQIGRRLLFRRRARSARHQRIPGVGVALAPFLHRFAAVVATTNSSPWRGAAQKGARGRKLDLTLPSPPPLLPPPPPPPFPLSPGVTFNSSLAPIGAGQCIRNIGALSPSGFGAVGQFGLFTEDNGVATSFDAGLTFTGVNISDLVASARYGAFPTANTWFVAAGDWPGEGSDSGSGSSSSSSTTSTTGTSTTPAFAPSAPSNKLFRARGDAVDPAHYMQEVEAGSTLAKTQSSRLHLLQKPSGGAQWATVKRQFLHEANLADGLGNATTWDAQIAVTTDGGKTWTVPFSKLGGQVSCGARVCVWGGGEGEIIAHVF